MDELQRIENQSIPEEIIQHIHSFLSEKEAARTTILSKSWYNAWSTCPNLDFSDAEFPDVLYLKARLEFAKKTMQRYDESNRTIHSFTLWMKYYIPSYNSRVKELITKAIKLRCTEISVTSWREHVVLLSHEVLQAETLVRLSLRNCKIDLHDHKVRCSRLKYLNLSIVCVEGGSFRDIISMCPLIKELILFRCNFGEDKTSESGLSVYVFRKLKVLSLEDVILIGCKEIQIRSDSLEKIRLFDIDIMSVKFDVPRIRKFKYYNLCVPSLSIKTTSRKWESKITFFLDFSVLKSSWFVELRQLLLELSPSKISLDLFSSTNWSPGYDIQDIMGLCKAPVVVETLMLEMETPSSLSLAFLDGLFRCCRPSFITLYWKHSWYMSPQLQVAPKANNNFVKLLCNTLVKESGKKRDMYALDDLEEVNAKFFEYDDSDEWRPLPLMTLSDDSLYSATTYVKVCLQLRWGRNPFKF